MSNKYLAKDGSPHPDTVEQAAKEYANNEWEYPCNITFHDIGGEQQLIYGISVAFIAGSKWQQEQGGEKDKEIAELKEMLARANSRVEHLTNMLNP